MSRCPAHEHLERFLARQLAPMEHTSTAEHLHDCPDCRAACTELAAVLASDTVTLDRPVLPDPRPTDNVLTPAVTADAPTVRLWRHELPRDGERPVQASAEFEIPFPVWPPAIEHPPTLPGYEILGELGRGGMGIVYKAKQVRLNRLVALKMILAEDLSDPESLARFRTEAESVVQLQHPNIVQIYEVGETDGRPYFSLEHVGGGSLAQRIAGKPQSPEAAAVLIETLARAIHYAHENGVIHRDLKPGNILLAGSGSPGRGSSDEELTSLLIADGLLPAKIADFGLAKSTTPSAPLVRTSPARFELIVGTPQYMAPEQANAAPDIVAPTVDVYALGAILYELLAGRPPFQGANATDTLLHVRFSDPIPPRVWQPKTPRDLDTIALKCLQKEARHRYPSARALADDLRLYLEGKPIKARPAALTERTWKWIRRHPAIACLGCISACAIVVAFATLLWQWRQSESRHADVDNERRETHAALKLSDDRLELAERNLYVSRIAQAHQHILLGQHSRANELLGSCLPPAGRPDRRHWEWHYLRRLSSTDGGSAQRILPDNPEHLAIALCFRGPHLLTIRNEGGAALHVWRPHSGELLGKYEIAGFSTAVRHGRDVAFSANSRYVAGLSALRPDEILIWDTQTGQRVAALAGASGRRVSASAFSPDGMMLVVANHEDEEHGTSRDNRLRAWNWQQGAVVWDVSLEGRSAVSLSFSADSRVLAVGGGVRDRAGNQRHAVLQVRSSQTGALIRELSTDRQNVIADVAISPDGRYAVSVHEGEGCAYVWDIIGEKRAICLNAPAPLTGLSFSPDGQRLAAVGSNTVLMLWQTTTWQEVLSLRPPVDAPPMDANARCRLTFDAEGRRIAATMANGGVIVWDTGTANR